MKSRFGKSVIMMSPALQASITTLPRRFRCGERRSKATPISSSPNRDPPTL